MPSKFHPRTTVRRPYEDRMPRWSEKHAELCCERRLLASKNFTGEITPAERKLLAHVRRELDWYEMAMLRPSFDRMQAQVRERRHLGREAQRLVAKVERACAETHARFLRKDLRAKGVP